MSPFPQPRYLLTSLALNDLAIGVLITPFGVVSALFHCWAFGEVVCQIQVSLRQFAGKTPIFYHMLISRFCTIHLFLSEIIAMGSSPRAHGSFITILISS